MTPTVRGRKPLFAILLTKSRFVRLWEKTSGTHILQPGRWVDVLPSPDFSRLTHGFFWGFFLWLFLVLLTYWFTYLSSLHFYIKKIQLTLVDNKVYSLCTCKIIGLKRIFKKNNKNSRGVHFANGFNVESDWIPKTRNVSPEHLIESDSVKEDLKRET